MPSGRIQSAVWLLKYLARRLYHSLNEDEGTAGADPSCRACGSSGTPLSLSGQRGVIKPGCKILPMQSLSQVLRGGNRVLTRD